MNDAAIGKINDGQHSGPPARRVGKYLRYRPNEVVAWLEAIDNGAA